LEGVSLDSMWVRRKTARRKLSAGRLQFSTNPVNQLINCHLDVGCQIPAMVERFSLDTIDHESSGKMSLSSCKLEKRTEADAVSRPLVRDSGERLVAGVKAMDCTGRHLRLHCIDQNCCIAILQTVQQAGYLTVQLNNF